MERFTQEVKKQPQKKSQIVVEQPQLDKAMRFFLERELQLHVVEELLAPKREP